VALAIARASWSGDSTDRRGRPSQGHPTRRVVRVVGTDKRGGGTSPRRGRKPSGEAAKPPRSRVWTSETLPPSPLQGDAIPQRLPETIPTDRSGVPRQPEPPFPGVGNSALPFTRTEVPPRQRSASWDRGWWDRSARSTRLRPPRPLLLPPLLRPPDGSVVGDGTGSMRRSTDAL